MNFQTNKLHAVTLFNDPETLCSTESHKQLETLLNLHTEMLFPTKCASWFIGSRSTKTKILETGHDNHCCLFRSFLKIISTSYVAVILSSLFRKLEYFSYTRQVIFSKVFYRALLQYFLNKPKEAKLYSLRNHLQISLLILREFKWIN